MMDITKELMDQAVIGGILTSVVEGSGGAAMSSEALPAPFERTPDPEVRTVKRKLIRGAEDKFRIVKEFDACVSAGGKCAILRREGIYASYIHRWRKDRDRRALLGLSNQKRGPKEDPAKKEKLRIIELNKQVLRLEKDLKKCHIIIDVQKKLSEILGIALPPVEDMPL